MGCGGYWVVKSSLTKLEKKLTEGSSPLPPPDVYSPAPEDFYEYEEGQSSSMSP